MSQCFASGKTCIECDACLARTDWCANVKRAEHTLMNAHGFVRVKSNHDKQAFATLGLRGIEHACAKCYERANGAP